MVDPRERTSARHVRTSAMPRRMSQPRIATIARAQQVLREAARALGAPAQRLGERPTTRSRLVDITCG